MQTDLSIVATLHRYFKKETLTADERRLLGDWQAAMPANQLLFDQLTKNRSNSPHLPAGPLRTFDPSILKATLIVCAIAVLLALCALFFCMNTHA